MKIFKISAVALLAVFLTFGSAYANIYNDGLTTEDTSGNWTYSGNITAASGTIVAKAPITVIDAPSDTTSTVTAAKTGHTFVLRAATGPAVGGVGYTLLLPTSASGLIYSFTTATNQTLSVKAQSGEKILVGAGASVNRITSAASTGTTVTLVGGGSGQWYVRSMSYGQLGDNTWAVATS